MNLTKGPIAIYLQSVGINDKQKSVQSHHGKVFRQHVMLLSGNNCTSKCVKRKKKKKKLSLEEWA